MQFISFFLIFMLSFAIFGVNKVSTIKTVISSLTSMYLYLTFPDNIDPIYGYYEPSLILFNFVFGYFMYELFVAIYNKNHVTSIIHACISMCAYSFGIYGYFSKYGLFFLSYDITTIFLNMVYQSDALIWKILFAVSFFLIRIVFGTIESINFIKHVLSLNDNFLVLCVIVNLMFILLNYYWFYKIIKKARRELI